MKIMRVFLWMNCLILFISVISASAQTKTKPKQLPLVGIKWQLTELRGVAVIKKQTNKESSFLQLSEEGRFSAFAGCNRLIGGYDVKDGFRIQFKGMASTRMACPDMKTEQIFGEVLKIVDNYSIKGNRLTLNKARMAPLAVFEAVK